MVDKGLEKLKKALEGINEEIDSLGEQGLHDIGAYLSPYYDQIRSRKKEHPELYKLLDDTLGRIKKCLEENSR